MTDGSTSSSVVSSTVETVEVTTDTSRPFLSTSFGDYTVTEGLLLAILLTLIVSGLLHFLGRWF